MYACLYTYIYMYLSLDNEIFISNQWYTNIYHNIFACISTSFEGCSVVTSYDGDVCSRDNIYNNIIYILIRTYIINKKYYSIVIIIKYIIYNTQTSSLFNKNNIIIIMITSRYQLTFSAMACSWFWAGQQEAIPRWYRAGELLSLNSTRMSFSFR